VVEFVDLLRGQLAPALGGNPLHHFEIPDLVRQNPAHDLAPFHFRVALHLPMEVRRQ